MTEPAGDGALPRRKFDDVASLFRPAVPGNGPSAAFPPHRPAFIPLPPTYTAPVRREPPAPPPADAPASEAPDTLPTVPPSILPTAPAQTRIEPIVTAPVTVPMPEQPVAPQPARPRPNEIPWPDAFQPRPNYRQPERSKWTWLLLIPAGLVAAAAITLVDPPSLRAWVDANILHRTPVVGTLDSPLLPKAFRNPAANPAPNAAAPGAEPNAESAAAPPAESIGQSPAPSPAPSSAPLPTPDPALLPTPSVETPALVIPPVSAIPPAPPAAPGPIHVVIQFRRSAPGADGEARRIAALLQSNGGSVELHPVAATARTATITYYNAPDKDAASQLATVLANEATAWTVRLGTAKNPPGAIDVWLP